MDQDDNRKPLDVDVVPLDREHVLTAVLIVLTLIAMLAVSLGSMLILALLR